MAKIVLRRELTQNKMGNILTEINKQRTGIGVLNEKSLHRQLIEYFSKSGDDYEMPFNKYFIDLVRGNDLFEIQTRNIFAIKKKLISLSETNTVHLIHPLLTSKTIIKFNMDGEIVSRRKSPKKNRVEDIFLELFRCGDLLPKDNLNLVLPFIEIEEIWKDDGKGSWRRGKWSIIEKRLLNVTKVFKFSPIAELIDLLPSSLPDKFSNKDIANHLQLHINLARKISYTLRIGNLISLVEKHGNSNIYKRT
jgi:hypothetical protein